MRVFNKQITTATPLNVNNSSDAVPLKSIYMYNIVAIITGTPTGNIKLQASNDPETNDSIPLPAPTNWVDIGDSGFALTSAGNTMWNVREIGYNYVRVVYTDISGGTSTATMTVIFNGKGV